MQLKQHKEISDLWLEYRDALNRYILKIVKDQDTADHLSHEVLLKIYGSCCSGRSIKNLRSWLFQIAYNTCMDHFNQEKRTTTLAGDFQEEKEDKIYDRASELVGPLINLLPEKYALPLAMSELQNIKQREIADQLKLSLPATKSRILRGKQKLKETIAECIHLELNSDGYLESFEVKADCKPLQAENSGLSMKD